MISEIEREKVLKQLDDAAEAIRNNPASDFTEEELRKKIEAVSTEEGLEMWSRLLKVAAGEPRPRSTEKTTLTAEVLKDTADRLNNISEVTGISVGEQIDRLCFNFHPYDAGLTILVPSHRFHLFLCIKFLLFFFVPAHVQSAEHSSPVWANLPA